MLNINEIPSGLINGVNTTYTTANTISIVTNLQVDGAEYFDFTFTGNTLILADAPTLSVRIDYYDMGATPPSATGGITLGQIKTRIWQEMEVNSDSSTYNTDRLRDMVNEVGLEILEGKVANELTNKYIQGNVLNFNKGKFAKTLISPKPLTDEVEIADTEILFDTTNYPTVGAILLGNEVITYTGKEADRITGVTGILSGHQKGTIVQPLYIVPADFWKPLKVYKFFDNKETEILYKDNINNLQRYYEIKEGYLFFYGVLAGDTYYIEYTKKYVNLEDDTDETIFPDHIALNIIPFICGGRMIKDEVLRVKLLSQGYNKLATEFAKQGEDIGKPKGINWKRFGFNSIR